MTEMRCPEAKRLYWAWIEAAAEALRIGQAAGFTGQRLLDEQTNYSIYQQTLSAYREHLRTCPVCLKIIRQIPAN